MRRSVLSYTIKVFSKEPLWNLKSRGNFHPWLRLYFALSLRSEQMSERYTAEGTSSELFRRLGFICTAFQS